METITHNTPARILLHRSSPVKLDPPPCTPASIEAAKRASARERYAEGLPLSAEDRDLLELPTEDEWERLAVRDGLGKLIQEFGAGTVMAYVRGDHRADRDGLGYLIEKYGQARIERYVRNLAALYGYEVK